jgi:hypothetical protein
MISMKRHRFSLLALPVAVLLVVACLATGPLVYQWLIPPPSESFIMFKELNEELVKSFPARTRGLPVARQPDTDNAPPPGN